MLKYAAWDIRLKDGRTVKPLTEAGLPYLTALTMAARGFSDSEAALDFCRADDFRMYDPFLLPDMDKAAGRIRLALERGEKIAVYGDYDLDGMTSAVLLYQLLTSMGANCEWFIPDRLSDGHGLHIGTLSRMRERGVSLAVTVDTGVTALREAAEARAMGLDLIITDHHECRESLPEAVAVVDPKIPGSRYPFPELAGVGVAFKLACALTGDSTAMLERYGALVALGTVADVAVLLDENRHLARVGLSLLARTGHPGLAALLREGARDERVTSQTIGFRLAPRLNAAGRLGQAGTAMELLLCDNPVEARRLAALLSEMNKDRKALENNVMEDAAAQLAACGHDPERSALVLAGEGWHPGVIGIVAGQLTERHGLPSFLISIEDGEGKGSARGVPGVSLTEALDACAGILEEYGGHALAAGFRVKSGNIPALREALNAFCQKALRDAGVSGTGGAGVCTADAEVAPEHLTLKDVRGLRMLEPYGAGHPEPLFMLCGALVRAVDPIGGGAHVRLTLEAGNRSLSCIWFFVREEQLPIRRGDRADILFTPDINCFRDTESVQLQLRDIRPSRRML